VNINHTGGPSSQPAPSTWPLRPWFGKQHVVVQYLHQHVEVGEGGQAMVAGQMKGVGAKRDGRQR
jgi:hypothetical protein